MSEDEPLYENVQKEMENVKLIDDRVINFLYIVKQAPRDIQKATDKFLASIDKLKKSYICNIVTSKKVEAKHSAAVKYYNLCQREYDFFRRQDDYLSQISAEEHYAVDEKLEMARLECAMCYCQLQLSVRELELSREKLCRLSKRSEHLFVSILRNHPDKGWAQIYKNDSQKPKSELKRVRSNPVVAPNPVMFRHCQDDSNLAGNNKERVNFHTMRPPSKIENCSTKTPTRGCLVKSKSLDIAGDNSSSDEEFPPPPPPLAPDLLNEHERVVVVDVLDRTKRYSERSAVDEGIGDIDWKPSSEDITRAVEAEIMAHVDRITELADNARFDDTERVPKQVINRSSKDDYSGTTNIPELNDKKLSEAHVSGHVNSQKELNIESEFPPENELVDDGGSISLRTDGGGEGTKLTVHENVETTISTVNELKNDVGDIAQVNDKIHERNNLDEQHILHNTHGVSDVISHDNTKSDNLRDIKLTSKGNDCQVKLLNEERKIHVYEDVPTSAPGNKQKKEKEKKKKSKLKLLTKMFHGPWEGWEG